MHVAMPHHRAVAIQFQQLPLMLSMVRPFLPIWMTTVLQKSAPCCWCRIPTVVTASKVMSLSLVQRTMAKTVDGTTAMVDQVAAASLAAVARRSCLAYTTFQVGVQAAIAVQVAAMADSLAAIAGRLVGMADRLVGMADRLV